MYILNIRQIRRAADVTQAKLAEKLNTSQPVVAAWESGRSTPSSRVMPLIADALNCKIEELYKKI